jgi:hypothetical protein
MTFKSILAVGVTALSLAGLVGTADAKTRIHIGIGAPPLWSDDCEWIGRQYHCFGPHYGNPHYDPRYGYYDDEPRFAHRIACGEARSMVRERGYRKVVTKECSGKSYSFSAVKNGHRYLVKVNAHTGRMKAYAL